MIYTVLDKEDEKMERKDTHNLYKEFEIERENLIRLVIDAKKSGKRLAANNEIISQSRKVDSIIEKISNEKPHMLPYSLEKA